MAGSKVYFTSFRTQPGSGFSTPMKLQKLIKAAGIATLPLKDNYVAIKTHFGESGNMAFLRPAYAAALVEVLKENGARPFLTDCNTLYVGKRKNALEHLEQAYKNGFTPYAMGCQVLIGDGLKGTDEAEVSVPNGILLKKALIGRAIMDADIIISLSHFKCHEMTGIGGAIKNLGMGCGSRAGKKAMHCDGITQVDQSLCIGCGKCVRECAQDAPKVTNGKASIDPEKCVGCGRCIGTCPKDAIAPIWNQASGLLDKKMAEYAAAVVAGRPNFHISLIVDVSPYCDCHSENDVPVVPDIGMFASFDPVALDQACADAVLNSPILKDSALAERKKDGCDYFTSLFPDSSWSAQLIHAEKLGIGTREYELIRV